MMYTILASIVAIVALLALAIPLLFRRVVATNEKFISFKRLERQPLMVKIPPTETLIMNSQVGYQL